MGFTRVKVRVHNPTDLALSDEVEFLVDTGAIFSSIPRPMLEKLGLRAVTRRKLRVYGGSVVERGVGGVVIDYNDSRAVVPVIFGEDEGTPILGATALEALGYQVDPVTKQLKPTELLMI